VGTGITKDGSRGKKMVVPPPPPSSSTSDTSNSSRDLESTIIRNTDISWTIEGQVEHKIAWVDLINEEMIRLLQAKNTSGRKRPNDNHHHKHPPKTLPKLIFLTHSFGAHLVQQLLTLRADLLTQTQTIIHLMPFIRFDPPPSQTKIISRIAQSPHLAIPFIQTLSRIASRLPPNLLDRCVEPAISGVGDRKLAIELARQPAFARNWLELGLREVREVPKAHDHATLRLIGNHCDTAMLFVGGPDIWAPNFHLEELLEYQRRGIIPSNINMEYNEKLLHDFVVHEEMIPPAIDFVLSAVLKEPSRRKDGSGLISRL